MAIERLRVQGFRSLADVEWKPGRLNVLIGPNGSGKSNLLRLLLLLQEAANGTLSESVRRAGGIIPLLWDGRERMMRVGFGASLGGVGLPRWLSEGACSYALALEQVGDGGAYRVALEAAWADEEPQLISELLSRPAWLLGVPDDGAHWEPGPGKRLLRSATRAAVFGDDGRHDGVDVALLKADETALSQLADPVSQPDLAAFRREVRDWRIYHDVRVDAGSEVRRPAVSRLERRVQPDGNNLVSALHTLYTTDRDFKDEVNTAMRAAFGPEFEELVFPPAADGLVQLRVRWRSLKREQSAADLSDGTLRFLFLVTVLASPDPPPLIAIDEPEVGLHPSMFPIVAEFAKAAAERTQVILTTHSPDFLDCFSDHPEVTTVVQCEEGRTVLRHLDEERLAAWLEQYRLGELFRSGELEAAE
jgi:predicted ATPase